MSPSKLNIMISFTSEMTTLITVTLTIALLYLICRKRSSQSVFLVDFACYKPPESLKCSHETTLRLAKEHGHSEEILSFMEKVLRKSGLGDTTYLPESIQSVPKDLTMEAARRESEMVIFGAIDCLLAKTGVECSEIGVLIINCTVFNVVPSLTSVVVNRYKLREDVCTYNLASMGCTASLLAINLAKHLLQVHPNTCALIVSTENTTSTLYTGTDPSKVIANCVFRVGGSVILLSNKPSHKKLAKYHLMHSLHTHTASSDMAYKCVFQEEDSDGIKGVTTSKNLLVGATSAIQIHLTSLGSRILPLYELLLFVTNGLINRLRPTKTRPYVPKFNTCVEHFLPHVGAKPILDEVQKKLGFGDGDMEPSRMTLHRYGNVSSSSVWYALAYAEAKGRVKKGDRVWQIAFGSGFKCGSVIWRALKCVEVDEMNPWLSDIDDYPVMLDKINGAIAIPDPFHFKLPNT